jgi:hypothetical protein
LRAASISKKAAAGRKPLTGVDCQPVRGQAGADGGEVGDAVGLQADLGVAVEVLTAGVALERGELALDELRPDLVLGRSVGAVVLGGEEWRGVREVSERGHGSLGRIHGWVRVGTGTGEGNGNGERRSRFPSGVTNETE